MKLDSDIIGKPNKVNYGLILRAILFALILCGPYLIEFRSSGPHSVSSFNDLDEVLYLRVAMEQGRYLPQEAIYYEHAQNQLGIIELLTHWRPDQTLTHFLVGRLSQVFNLGILELNLVLDLFVISLCYLLFSQMFLLLIPERHYASEACAIFVLAFPWTISLENFFTLHSLVGAWGAVLPGLGHTTLPVMEGLEAQLSTIWLAICVTIWLKSRRRGGYRYLILGAASGVAIYVYTLEWMAVSVLFPILVACDWIFCARPLNDRSESRWPSLLGSIGFFGAANIVVALPGILIISRLKQHGYIFIDDLSIYSTVFYAPTEWIVLALVFIAVLYSQRNRERSELRLVLALILSLILSELVLLNIQPLTGVATVGIFIVGTFTRPLLTGAVLALVFCGLARFKLLRIVSKVLVWGLLLLALTASQSRFAATRSEDNELSALISAVEQQTPKESVLAMLTFNRPFQQSTREWDWRWTPNAVAAIADRHLLKEALGLEWGALPPIENIERELALSTLFTGTPTLLRACDFELRTQPKAIFFQQWIAVQLSRKFACQVAKETIRSASACQMIQRFRIDFVIWEPHLTPTKPAFLEKSAEMVWRSNSGRYELLKLDQKVATRILCE